MSQPFRLADLPLRPVPFSELPYVRGHVDTLVPLADGSVNVSGWMAAPGEPIEEVEIHHEGRHLETRRIVPRPDVKACYEWLAFADLTGFDFQLPLTAEQAARTTRLDLVSRYKGKRRGRMSQLIRADVDRFPSPPEALIYRVSHMRDAHAFKVRGLKSVGDFFEPFARHGDLTKVRRILDWGCGCGRMSMYVLAADDCPEFAGCDVDPTAIAWSNENLRRGAFSVLNPLPPAPYPDAHFDLIYSFSVFTHLTRDVQHAWLKEMRRLLAPGGTFIATTHGQLALDFALSTLASRFPREGIADAAIDPTLGDIVPENYYRSTFQSKEYTLREFGKYFTPLEYVERGATNMQDLIVLRK